MRLPVGCDRAVHCDMAEDLVDQGQHVLIFDGVVGVPAFPPGGHDFG